VLLGLVIFLLASAAALVVGIYLDADSGGAGFGVAAVAYGIWVYLHWRCPGCGRSLVRGDPEDRTGLSHCPGCGAELEGY
jgi:hypothetical protein